MRSIAPSSSRTRAEPWIWMVISVERLPDPADFQLLAVERAVLDGAAIVIGLELLLVVEAADGAAVGKGRSCHRLGLRFDRRLRRRLGQPRITRSAGAGRSAYGIPDWESASPRRSARNSRSGVRWIRRAWRSAPARNSARRMRAPWPYRRRDCRRPRARRQTCQSALNIGRPSVGARLRARNGRQLVMKAAKAAA